MQCHLGFWAWVKEHGADLHSPNAAHFASRYTTDSEKTEKWLLTRTGKKLRKLWMQLPKSTRDDYMKQNKDDHFPLNLAADGIRDARQDRSRYPRLVAEVATPQVVSLAPEASNSLPALAPEVQQLVEGWNTRRDELLKCTLASEVYGMGLVRTRDDCGVAVVRAISVIECMGAQIANAVPLHARDQVNRIVKNTVQQLDATGTLLTMDTDTEAHAIYVEMKAHERSADENWSNFTADACQNTDFKLAFDARTHFDADAVSSYAWLNTGVIAKHHSETACSSIGTATYEDTGSRSTPPSAAPRLRKRGRESSVQAETGSGEETTGMRFVATAAERAKQRRRASATRALDRLQNSPW